MQTLVWSYHLNYSILFNNLFWIDRNDFFVFIAVLNLSRLQVTWQTKPGEMIYSLCKQKTSDRNFKYKPAHISTSKFSSVKKRLNDWLHTLIYEILKIIHLHNLRLMALTFNLFYTHWCKLFQSIRLLSQEFSTELFIIRHVLWKNNNQGGCLGMVAGGETSPYSFSCPPMDFPSRSLPLVKNLLVWRNEESNENNFYVDELN